MASAGQKRIVKVGLPDPTLLLLKTHTAQELGDITNNPPTGMTVKLVNDNDLYKWDVTMSGPSQSCYRVCRGPLSAPSSLPAPISTARTHERTHAKANLPPTQDATFKLLITLPHEYPFKPPQVSFTTRIYHPNVSNDDKGSMCIGMLRADEWKPPNRIAAVLDMVRNLLVEPNIDDAVEMAIAEQYRTNAKEFEKVAKEWVKRYAKV